MAQASNTTGVLKKFQNLTEQANEQQKQFTVNKQSAEQLQSTLNTNTHKPTANNNNDEESKTNNTVNTSIKPPTADLTNLRHAMSAVNMKPSGIEPSTQGELTILHKNKEIKSDHYHSSKYVGFASMSDILRPELLDGCDKMNFTHPSKIQAEAIPICISNDKTFPNLIGQAHHGSGKTATFTLIMLQRVNESDHKLQGMVVVHSRELAIQTHNVCQSLGQFISGLKTCLALKGATIPTPWDRQICIGTPGTIIDKIFNASKRTRDGLKGFLSSFKIFIVDEADEFLKTQSKKSNKNTRGRGRGRNKGGKQDFGSLFDQLKMISVDLSENVGTKFQTMLFSATFPSTVKKLALEIAPDPFIIKVAQKQVQLDNIKIFKVQCENEMDKFNTLLRVISLANVGQMIIFVNTVKKAKLLIDALEGKDLGIACSALYGRGMDIALRDKTMEEFRKSQTQCLVASNVIARGIDVPAVGLVVNFEVPTNLGKNVANSSGNKGSNELVFDSETFMHRVGRTGRFGAKGACINLVAKDDSVGVERLNGIQKEYSLDIQHLDNTAKTIKETIGSWLQQTH